MVQIEPVSEYDATEILSLIEEYFPYVTMDFDKLVRRIHSPRFIFHKSMEKEQFTGYAEWEILDEKKKLIRLNGIVIIPRFREKKHASALLEKGEATAKQKGMKTITLLVMESNSPAQKLYKKHDYSYARPHTHKINGEKTQVWEKKLV